MPCPPFKYAGGKWWMVLAYAHLFPSAEEIARRGGTYREPFVGAGAMAYGLFAGRCRVVLSDVNPLVVNAHRMLRDRLDELLARLAAVHPLYSRQTYLAWRAALNAGDLPDLERAVALFVVLAWGYNGLLRMSARGQCNTPPGRPSSRGKRPPLGNHADLRLCSFALKGATIREHDFEVAVLPARRGDFVYFDPVYEPAKPGGFVAYSKTGWRSATDTSLGGSDLKRLVAACVELDRRGVDWALSNNDTPITRAAFARWNIHAVEAQRSVNSDSDGRGPVSELIVTSYATPRRVA